VFIDLTTGTALSKGLTLIFACGFFVPCRRRRHVPPKCQLLQDPHGVTSQKTALDFFKVIHFTVSAHKNTCFNQYDHHQVFKIVAWCKSLCLRFRSSLVLAFGPVYAPFLSYSDGSLLLLCCVCSLRTLAKLVSLGQLKIALSSSVIEPATSRLVT
jgi:hypothetical protein